MIVCFFFQLGGSEGQGFLPGIVLYFLCGMAEILCKISATNIALVTFVIIG